MANERFPSQAHKSQDVGRGSIRSTLIFFLKRQTFFPLFKKKILSQVALTTILPLHVHKYKPTQTYVHNQKNTNFLPSSPHNLPDGVCGGMALLPTNLWHSSLADWLRTVPHKNLLQLGAGRPSNKSKSKQACCNESCSFSNKNIQAGRP